jgi:hypothetical protein
MHLDGAAKNDQLLGDRRVGEGLGGEAGDA